MPAKTLPPLDVWRALDFGLLAVVGGRVFAMLGYVQVQVQDVVDRVVFVMEM
jgi:hypothetical protein